MSFFKSSILITFQRGFLENSQKGNCITAVKSRPAFVIFQEQSSLKRLARTELKKKLLNLPLSI